jgi:hypothetical protein
MSMEQLYEYCDEIELDNVFNNANNSEQFWDDASDEEKYKALLLMVQKALIMAYKNDTDKRNNLSDLEKKIETEPKEAEKTLQSFLDSTQSNFPENSF